MKILISAYSCTPGRGSESGIGWNVVTRMAQFHDVWVVTRTHNRADIEKVFIPSLFPKLHFTYFDLPIISRWVKTNHPRLFNQVYYYFWHVFIYFFVLPLHRQHQFDLVHHITWGRYWMPNSASFLPVPFIFGPVAGGETVPKAFQKELRCGSWIYQALRVGFRWLGEHDPFVQATIKRSTIVLAASEATLKRVKSLGARTVILSGPQVGINQEEMNRLGKLGFPLETPFRLMSIGRLLHWKGVHLSLKAFALSKLEDSEFWIVGTGPEKEGLQRLAFELEIADRVKFLGWLPREEVWKRLEQCHVLLHPCLHDLVTTAYLEAMAARRPVITVGMNYRTRMPFLLGTEAEITTLSPEDVIKRLSTTIQELCVNKVLREQIGQTERDFVVQTFTWEKKVLMLESLYPKAEERAVGTPAVCRGENLFTNVS